MGVEFVAILVVAVIVATAAICLVAGSAGMGVATCRPAFLVEDAIHVVS